MTNRQVSNWFQKELTTVLMRYYKLALSDSIKRGIKKAKERKQKGFNEQII